MTVADASVIVAASRPGEQYHDVCRDWLHAAVLDGPVHAPAILLPEVAGALARGGASPEAAHLRVQQLLTGGIVSLELVTPDLATRAAEIAANQKMRGCDAIYVALSEHLGEPLVTLDQEQLDRGARVTTVMPPGTRDEGVAPP